MFNLAIQEHDGVTTVSVSVNTTIGSDSRFSPDKARREAFRKAAIRLEELAALATKYAAEEP